MTMTSFGVLCLLLAHPPVDDPPVPVVAVEPGKEWEFQGTIRTKTTGEHQAEGEFSFRLRYLTLESDPSGGRKLLQLREIEPGIWKQGGRESKPPGHQGSLVLNVDERLRMKAITGARHWTHAATPYLELVPFPPAGARAEPGAKWEEREELKPGFERFAVTSAWTAEAVDGGVRITRAPAGLPAPCACKEKETQLRSYRETFDVDPATGACRAYALAWKSHNQDDDTEVVLELKLVQSREVPAEQVTELRDDLADIEAFKKKVALEGADLEAAAKEADEVAQRLTGSPLAAMAPELQQAVGNAKSSREYRLKEKRTRDRLLGRPAPDFTAQDLDGNEIALAKLHGKAVLLNFWASW